MAVYNFDKQWLFYLGNIPAPELHTHGESYMAAKAGGAAGAASPDYDTSGWQTVDLPHDWAVEGEFDPKYGPSQGYKPRGEGWYKKRFKLDEADADKELYVEFDGVSSYATVWLNGSVVGRNFGGYNSFVVNITDMALYGDSINDITVHADATPCEGWWYEGAGIYRHVRLIKKHKLHIPPWGVYVHPRKVSSDIWDTLTDITVKNASYTDKSCRVKAYIVNAENNTVGNDETTITIAGGGEQTVQLSLLTYSPLLWDTDDPNLYSMVTEIYDESGTLLNRDIVKFGYRTIEISADDGFMLNGRRVPIYGTCNHQDHAGVGVAVPDRVNEYRVRLLKEMGSNAYRTAHGNPTPEILDYCDKYGLLVMDENRSFNSSPDGINQVRAMVMRDRNHPSVVMYSIFNEEPLQGEPRGRKLAERLQSVIKSLDPDRFTVGAMNTGVTAEGGACDVLDMTGFNYITHTYDDFREKFPHMPMIGTENDSAFATRGVYKTDYDKHVIDCYDSVAAPWGNTYRDGFKQIDTRPHIMGMFIWTGFDYRGEPTPFEWESVSTQFGIMDTCGFKKDVFYLNKAFFTDEPFIHVLPHWSFTDGEQIRVMVYTNCPEAEIFINGVSEGRKPVDKYDMAEWSVTFTAGELKAVGYTADDGEYIDIRRTAGDVAALKLSSPFDTVFADDGFPVNVAAADSEGIFVPTADNLIEFSAAGGEIIGVGNGDPNSHEADKSDTRRLFNGLAQCIVKADTDADEVIITAHSGDMVASVAVEVQPNPNALPEISSVTEKYITKWRRAVELSSDFPDVNAVIAASDMNTWAAVTVGAGNDPIFGGAGGYAHYRTELIEGGRLLFKGISGSRVWIYVNGVLACEECADWEIRPQTDDIPAGARVDVIIYCADKKAGGIVKPIVLI